MNDYSTILIYFAYFIFAIGLIGFIYVFVYYFIKKNPISDERFEKLVELAKWYIISAALVIITTIIDYGFKEREHDIKEMETFDKYVDKITEVDGIEKRWLLSEYFAIVSPDGSLKNNWIAYKKLIEPVYTEYITNKKREAELAAKDTLNKSEEKEFIHIQQMNEILEQSLAPTKIILKEDWIIVSGADKELSAAKDEEDRVKKLGLEALIYKKGNMFRTVIGPFSTKDEALSNLGTVKSKLNKTAYLMRLNLWCNNATQEDGYLICK